MMLPETKEEKILVVVPAYNEEMSLGRVIDGIRENLPTADVLVVDDGSSDGTPGIVRDRGVFLVQHVYNLGIGASLQTGCRYARAKGYDYLLRMDGDGQHGAESMRGLLDSVRGGAVDIAIGSRFLGESPFKSSFFRLFGILLIALALKVITGKKVTDPTSGFCAMNRKALLFFAENCPDDYPEPQILLYQKSFRIAEVPVMMSKRHSGLSSITPRKSIAYIFNVMLALLVTDTQRRKP